jgi:hypothetical protein
MEVHAQPPAVGAVGGGLQAAGSLHADGSMNRCVLAGFCLLTGLVPTRECFREHLA